MISFVFYASSLHFFVFLGDSDFVSFNDTSSVDLTAQIQMLILLGENTSGVFLQHCIQSSTDSEGGSKVLLQCLN